MVNTSHNIGMAIGMMYATQKMKNKTMFSTPAFRLKSGAFL
jgi:hypothetical protein